MILEKKKLHNYEPIDMLLKNHLHRTHYSLMVEKLLTYCLQQADIFSQGAHTTTKGEEEHEDPNHHQHYSGVQG